MTMDIDVGGGGNPSTFPSPADANSVFSASVRSYSPPLHGSPSPGPRAVPIEWQVDPHTGERFLDTESLMGSVRSMESRRSLGSASMSISSAASMPK